MYGVCLFPGRRTHSFGRTGGQYLCPRGFSRIWYCSLSSSISSLRLGFVEKIRCVM
jgi:hypothetical protein